MSVTPTVAPGSPERLDPGQDQKDQKGQKDQKDRKNRAISAAILGSVAAVAAVELLLILGGWIAHPTLGHLAWLTVPLVVIASARGVRGSARAGRDYAGQLVAGLEIGLFGGLGAALVVGLMDSLLASGALSAARELAPGDAAELVTPLGRALLRFIEVMVVAAFTGLASARRGPADPA